MVTESQPAPTFTLPSGSGDDVSLESFRGQPVVLYLYPKDDTLSPFDSRSCRTQAA